MVKVVLVFLLIITYQGCSSKNSKKQEKVLDLAHRGYASIHQESSFNAFKYAVKEQTDGLEFDIRQTIDDVIIVSHDRYIEKLDEYIEVLTYKQIQNNTNLLTLKELIRFAKKNNKTIWVEMKDSHLYPNILDNTLKVIENEDYGTETIIQSFELNDLKYINNKNSDIQLLKLDFFKFYYDDVPEYISFIGLPISTGIFDLSLIERVHKENLKVIFWREGSLFEHKYFINLLIHAGADGFMLDRPLTSF